MTNFKLLKGFEVELFTGKFSGENIGVASAITDEISDATPTFSPEKVPVKSSTSKPFKNRKLVINQELLSKLMQ